jgi:NAD(P)-dependent dehydrogenase (short-subunit alcohol dehydrogenase family)
VQVVRARIALVTGGNRGIGLEVCRQLAGRGLQVVLSARDRDAAAAAARAIGHDVQAIQLDVVSEASIDRAKADLDKRFGGIDVLINNAAILLNEYDSLVDTPLDNLRRTFETNVFGAVAVSQAFVPGMIDRGYGRVVNVSSRAGQLTTISGYAPAYSMSKTALNALTQQLAVATNGSGVLVNSACPGWVQTAMGGPSAPRSVEEGADTIVWLATLPDDGPTGRFFADRQAIAW